MRTDAKVGFAIGGVLLAMIIAYLVVVPRHSHLPNKTVTMATTGQPSPAPQASTPTSGAESSGTPATPAEPSPASSVTPGSSTANSTPGNGSNPTVTETPSAGAGENPSATPAAPSDNPVKPEQVAKAEGGSAGTSGGVNWDKLFAGGAVPASTDSQGNSSAGANASGQNAAGANSSTGQGGIADSNGSAGGAQMGGAAAASRSESRSETRNEARNEAGGETGNAARVAGGNRQYTIKAGQTLSAIAADVYGNSRFYVAIMRANPNLNPNRLRPGMHITLPDVSDIKPGGSAAGEAASSNAGSASETSGAGAAAGGGVIMASVADSQTDALSSTGRVYAVQRGDTLYKISKRLFGTPREANVIYAMNADTIGPNPAKLKLGMVLRLPE